MWVAAKEIRDCLPGHGELVRFQRGKRLFQFLSSHASPQSIIGRKLAVSKWQSKAPSGWRADRRDWYTMGRD
jgi:hypothetical protein